MVIVEADVTKPASGCGCENHYRRGFYSKVAFGDATTVTSAECHARMEVSGVSMKDVMEKAATSTECEEGCARVETAVLSMTTEEGEA